MSNTVKFVDVGRFDISIDGLLAIRVLQAEDLNERKSGAMVMIGDEILETDVKAKDVSFQPGQWNKNSMCIHFRDYAFPIDDDAIPAIKAMFSITDLKAV
ncbi:hypothetical protein [Arsukibacterium indicum]|uniref:Uncharacterized protein n=1 Tax=Arsukibacterium indicum TaxID=2848612 RepID=A0ABS6MII2_9GAMM|nr:hypothetical protein [Arsukibacterium indicum]MBV2128141.1 hypothetical protein [Arsukibacterium indicum]